MGLFDSPGGMSNLFVDQAMRSVFNNILADASKQLRESESNMKILSSLIGDVQSRARGGLLFNKEVEGLEDISKKLMEIQSSYASMLHTQTETVKIMQQAQALAKSGNMSYRDALELLKQIHSLQGSRSEKERLTNEIALKNIEALSKVVRLKEKEVSFAKIANSLYAKSGGDIVTQMTGEMSSLRREGRPVTTVYDRLYDVGNMIEVIGEHFVMMAEETGNFADRFTGLMAKAVGSMAKSVAETLHGVDEVAYGLSEGVKILSYGQEGFSGMLKMGFTALSKTIGAAMPGIGQLIGTLGSSFISAIMFRLEDAIKLNWISQISRAQLGRAGGTERFVRSIFGTVGREEAFEWQRSLAATGAMDIDEKVTGSRLLKIKYGQALSIQETTQYLNQFMIFSKNSSEAAKNLEDAFAQMKAAAQGTEIPVRKMVDWIGQAAAEARFLNVDYKVVANTMEYLAKREEQLARGGVSVREHGGKILSELTGAKFTDEMHAFLGMKAGISTDPIKAMVGSMLGKEAMESMRFTAGGGIEFTKRQSENEMMAKHFEAIVMTLQDATRGMDEQTAWYARQKMAQEVFGFSKETARTLATADLKDIKTLLQKNPEMLYETKSQKRLMGEMLSVAQHSERIQRNMSNVMIKLTTLVALLPASIGAHFSRNEEKIQMIDQMIGATYVEGVQQFLKAANLTEELTKAVYSELSRVRKAYGLAEPEKSEGKATGGFFTAGQMKRGFWVGERGPEFISFDEGGLGGRVTPTSELFAHTGGSSNKVWNVFLRFDGMITPEQFAQKLIKVLTQYRA